ncbi:MAG: succinylglutamate desuccinylase/aspartoacylase family protein [Alphaproteobacteria bacterium]|nr:succinylglutamate desuccinylase/aspartoacylase family protein [Alphaproteobacteria bacterium]
MRAAVPDPIGPAGWAGVPHVLRIDTGRAGPHLVVNALTHGNEVCGLAALRAVLRRRKALLRGVVTLVAANPAAHRRHDPAMPQSGRFIDEDLNRLWARARLRGPEHNAELDRARALAPIYRSADILLDIHSMATGGPPLLMFHPTRAADRLLARLPRDHHRIRFAAPIHTGRLLVEQPGLLGRQDKAAFVVECGRHGTRATDAYAVRITLALLRAAGMLRARASGPVRGVWQDVTALRMVRARSDAFRFGRPLAGFERVAEGEIYAHDGMRPLRAPFGPCILLLPRLAPKRGGEAVILALPTRRKPV